MLTASCFSSNCFSKCFIVFSNLFIICFFLLTLLYCKGTSWMAYGVTKRNRMSSFLSSRICGSTITCNVYVSSNYLAYKTQWSHNHIYTVIYSIDMDKMLIHKSRHTYSQVQDSSGWCTYKACRYMWQQSNSSMTSMLLINFNVVPQYECM